MKQKNTGGSLRLSTAAGNGAHTTKTERRSSGLLSRTKALLSFAALLSLQLLASKANAQIAHYTASNGTGTTVVYAANSTGTALTKTGLGTTTPCGSGGLSGLTNNGVTTFSTSNGHVYFTVTANSGYVLNVTGYTCKLRRSGSGIQKVRMAYTTGASVINDLIDQAPNNSSCGAGSTVYSYNTTTGGALPTGVTTFTAELFPYAPISSGGTIQFNDITINGTVDVNPVSCPSVMATGTVTPTSSAVCGGTGVLLNLGGYSTGTAVTYQWQSSPDGSSWSDISGETNTTYNAISSPTVTTTTYYRANSTCTVTPTTVNSSAVTVTVNPTPSAGAITGSLVVTQGTTSTLTNPTASTGGSVVGVWSSLTPAVGSIDPVSGVFGGVSAGNTTISYTVTDVATGCDASTSATGSVLFTGDLGLYAGDHGISTYVAGVSGESASSLSATGFGSASTCSVGGLSGLTVNTVNATYSATGPHVSYILTPDAGQALNATRFWVSSRSSSTGPTMARLAYNVNGTGWVDEGVDHTLSVGGSCGAHSNTWEWTPPAALNGITGTLEIAIFPYAPGSSTGTFQLQQLEVIGVVTSSVTCSSAPAAGVITPSVTVACTSGYADLSFAGDAGPGISYQWYADDHSGSGFLPISGASNVFYTSPVYSATTTYTYEVVSTCSGSGAATSVVSEFSVVPTPTAIDGVSPHEVTVGTPLTLTNSGTPGGEWSSQHFSVATIGSASGTVDGLMPGITVITYGFAGFHCSVTTTVNVTEPNTLSAYLGTGGNSTTVAYLGTGVTASAVTNSGFGSASPCSTGGQSGLTESTSITSFGSTNPNVTYTMSVSAATAVGAVNVTTRSSATGPQMFDIAYSADGGTITSAGTFSADVQSCGVSTMNSIVLNIAPVTVNTTFAVYVYPYSPISGTGTFQVNAIDIQGGCAAIGSITSANGGLNSQTYAGGCPDLALSCSPSGGTWSSSDPVNAPVDASGNLTFNAVGADEAVTITYTDPCGVSTTATFTLSATPEFVCDGSGAKPGAPAVAPAVSGVQLYPNPANDVLNIVAAEKVNVTIMSVDGKSLISQNDASSINVSSLASGIYLIKVYNQKDVLIKTAKFTKE